MSDNVLNYAVATGAIVIVANLIEKKEVNPAQIIGAVIYAFGLSAINGIAPNVANGFALLVLTGVMLTRGYTVITTLQKV